MSDAALRATADALARQALSELPAAPSRADLARLAAPVARLLTARLDAAVERAMPVSAWVDADDLDVFLAREAWREAATVSVRIPAEEREAEVRGAVTRALFHLVRPAETLAEAAFEGETGAVPVSTVIARLRAFGPYRYLPRIAERYVERKALDRLDRDELKRLLLRIDQRMVSALDADAWIAILEPVFEWAGSVGRPPGSIPTSLLRSLFEAKGALALHNALDGLDTVDALTLRQLIEPALVEDVPTEAAAVDPEAAPHDAARVEAALDEMEVDDVPSLLLLDEPAPLARSETAPEAERAPDETPAHADLGDVPLLPRAETDGTARAEPEPVEADAEPEELAQAEESSAEAPDFEPSAPSSPEPIVWTTVIQSAPKKRKGTRMFGAGKAPAPPLPLTPVIGAGYGAPESEAADPPDVTGPASSASETAGPEPSGPDAISTERPLYQSFVADGAVAGADAVEPGEALITSGRAAIPAVLDATPASPTPTRSLADSYVSGETTAAADSDEKPLWQALAEESESVPEPDDEETPLWKRFAGSDTAERLPGLSASDESAGLLAPDFAPPNALDPLEARVLGPDAHERRPWYVDELFGGSPSDYHRTLAAINRAETYTEATTIISSEILRKRMINPYSECAVAFIDAVQDNRGRR